MDAIAWLLLSLIAVLLDFYLMERKNDGRDFRGNLLASGDRRTLPRARMGGRRSGEKAGG